MFFDPNQTEFISDYQRTIWQYGIQIVPIEASLVGIVDEETREGCTQIYNCVMEILTDMYSGTGEYTERPAYYFGHNGFMKLTLFGGDKYVMWDDKALRVLQKLSKYGFAYDDETNTLSNTRYPLFCKYYTQFIDLYKKRKQNMGDWVKRLDFRLFTKRIILTFDDLLRPLTNTERAYFSELRDYAISKGMKEERAETTLFRYTYNKNRSLELRTTPAKITIPYGLSRDIESPFERFLQVAEKQTDADALVKYILDNLKFCDGCAANVASRVKEKEKKKCGYYYVNIRDKKQLSCAASGITTSQYSRPRVINDEDIRMMKRMVDIRVAQIDSI